MRYEVRGTRYEVRGINRDQGVGGCDADLLPPEYSLLATRYSLLATPSFLIPHSSFLIPTAPASGSRGRRRWRRFWTSGRGWCWCPSGSKGGSAAAHRARGGRHSHSR